MAAFAVRAEHLSKRYRIGGPQASYKTLREALVSATKAPGRWLSRGRNVFAFQALGQYIQAYGGSSVPFFDRFFMGGETTIRGFDIRSVSPLAISSTPKLDRFKNPIVDPNTGMRLVDRNIISIGGDTLGIFNVEYRIPVTGPLSVAAFYDMGLSRVGKPQGLGVFTQSSIDLIKSTNNVIRGSTGVEIQFLLPVISAPFRLIFAYNPQIYHGTIMVGTTPLELREPRKDVKFTIGRSF